MSCRTCLKTKFGRINRIFLEKSIDESHEEHRIPGIICGNNRVEIDERPFKQFWRYQPGNSRRNFVMISCIGRNFNYFFGYILCKDSSENSWSNFFWDYSRTHVVIYPVTYRIVSNSEQCHIPITRFSMNMLEIF